MKKTFLLSISTLILGFYACEKEEVTTIQNSTFNSKISSSLGFFYDNDPTNDNPTWGVDIGCAGSGGNCIPVVVITEARTVSISMLYKKINNSNDSEIRNYFLNNNFSLEEIIPSSLIKGTISGQLKVSTRGKEGDSFVVIFKENNKIVAVCPFVK
ncbi:MAG: hypothetical protein Q4B43_04425 [Bacteroidota bacterium]|nr:hypothetical protein [Bacteroidota bacterium]